MPTKKEKNVSSLMDINNWQRFQDSLSMMTGLALLTLDPQGRPLTEPSNINEFCLRHLRRSGKNLSLCEKSHLKASRSVSASGRPVIYHCHAGFAYFAIPLTIGNVHVTTLCGGQIMARDFNSESLKKLLAELKINVPDFEGELQRVATMPEDKFIKTKELIESLVGMITQVNFEKYGLSKKVAELSALHEISDLVGSVGELEKMLHHLCDKITELVGVEQCSLIVRDKSHDRFIVASSAKMPQSFRGNYIALTRDIIFERRFFVKEPLLIEQITKIRDGADFINMYKQAGITTRVTAPLMVRDTILGLLEIYPGPDIELTKELNDLLIQVAYQTAVAIDNASIFSHAERLASIDGLTGLLNYRTFHHQLSMETKRAGRYGLSLSFIMIDIDNFKSVNDTFGHLIGNIVLSELAAILKMGVREVDLVSRFGGEEFAIVLPETSSKGALILAERLRKAIATHPFPGPGTKTLRLTVSVGVAEFSKEKMQSADDLIEAADQALLRAKATGKDRVISSGAAPTRKKKTVKKEKAGKPAKAKTKPAKAKTVAAKSKSKR